MTNKVEKKLLKRINDATLFYDRVIDARVNAIRKDFKYRATPQSKLREIAQLDNNVGQYDHQQWHDWHKANSKRQRQATALRRLRKKSKQQVRDLKRSAVPSQADLVSNYQESLANQRRNQEARLKRFDNV